MEVQKIIKDAYEKCRQILLEHKDALDRVAESLIELETLDAEQILSLVNEGKLPENHHGNKLGDSDMKVNINGKQDGRADGTPYEETTNLDQGENEPPADGGSQDTDRR